MTEPAGDVSRDTVAVRSGETIDSDALRTWLAIVAPEMVPAGVRIEIRQFPAGFSNLTYRVGVVSEHGERAYVLRRPPRGVKPGIAHDMGREHDLLAALHPLGVPVPRAIARCDDAAVIGAPNSICIPSFNETRPPGATWMTSSWCRHVHSLLETLFRVAGGPATWAVMAATLYWPPSH